MKRTHETFRPVNTEPMKKKRYGILTIISCALLFLLCINTGCGPEVDSEASFTNSVGMEMIKLDSGYYVSKYETRQDQYEQIMGINPSFHKGSNLPVDNITAAEANDFCNRLTALEKSLGKLPKGYSYSLPTFDQWLEYTADASLDGSITPYGTPGKKYETAQPVGSGEVNRFGIYDLRGNVTEYSKDLYNTGSNLVLGGDYGELREEFLRVKNRAGFMSAEGKGAGAGFRCVLVAN